MARAGNWDNFSKLTHSSLFLTQDISQSGASTTNVVHSDFDVGGLVNWPNKLCEELVRIVASLHQRAAESHTVGALARTGSQALGASKRVFSRRSSQVSSHT